MIESFKHRGLKRLYDQGDASKLRADQLSRIEDVLFHLDSATTPGDLDLPGYQLHPLKGDMKGYWSVTISGNWRIIFRFVKGGAYDVDLIDYH
jgi:proteic killer suppression protein